MTTENKSDGVLPAARLDAVLFEEESLEHLLARFVRAVEASVPNASSVSVMLEGGSLFAGADGSADGAVTPDDAQRAAEEGVRWTMSVPLLVRGEVAGSINLYSREVVPFSETDREVVEALTAHAGILASNLAAYSTGEDRNTQLVKALETREMVGQAMGILMERESCTREAAFDMLRRASQRENEKLRDVAQRIISTVEARAGG
jgi:GAF domain-containing protein